jgi:hypothetical protein
MAKSTSAVNRRGFLKGAATAAAGAAALTTQIPASDAEAAQRTPGPATQEGGAPPPTPEQIQRDGGDVRPPATTRQRAVMRPGSDLMVQVLRDLGIEYIAGNPGSSFEGLQESVINYGNPPNRMPEFITALHEESAVTMAHGYGKAMGVPMAALLHGTIGVQHAAMSIYQAYYDRTPAVLIAGRDLGFIAAHSANDMAGMVRSFTKWDAQPKTLAETLVALQRAYVEAVTPPMGPTLVVIDIEHQKEEARDMKVPAHTPPRITGIDASQAREIAKGLLDAVNPRIAVGRLRTPEGVKQAVQLAELVGASTSTAATQGPMSFPQRHALCGPGAATSYDYTLGLETQGAQASIVGPGLATLLARDPGNIGFGGIAPSPGRVQPAASGRALQADADGSASHRSAPRSMRPPISRRGSKRCSRRSSRRRLAGTRARSAPRASTPSCGRSSCARTGACRRRATFRAGTTRSCGITTSRTAIWVGRAQAAWATARLPPSARRSPPRLAAASSSTCRPTAI